VTPPPPVALRITGPCATALGGGDSLHAQNTRLLVDGTIAQVNDVGRQYYLDLDSTAAPSGTLIIQPALGPGRWFQQAGTGGGGEIDAVPTIADRDAIPMSLRFDGMLVYVQDLQVTYQLLPDLASWVNEGGSPNLSRQTAWYVHADTGNDNNDGKTPGTALASMTELANRLCPRGVQLVMTNDVDCYVDCNTSASFIRVYLSVTTEDPTQNFFFNIIGGVVSSAPITLSAVVAANAPTTRSKITTLSGAFVYQKMIRMTSGSAVGCVTYSTGLNGGPTETFVGEFVVPENDGFHTPHLPAPGDTCVIDDLKIRFFQSEFYGSNGAVINVKFFKIQRFMASGSLNSRSADGGGNVVYGGCEMVSTTGRGGIAVGGGALLIGCRVIPTGKTSLCGSGWLFYGTVVQGILNIAGGDLRAYGLVIDAGHIAVGTTQEGVTDTNPSSLTINGSYNGNGGLEVENGPENVSLLGASLVISGGSTVFINGVAWGLAGTYAIGILMQAGAWLYVTKQSTVTALADILKIPSTINIKMPGHSVSFTSLPFVLYDSNCGAVLGDASVNFGESYVTLAARAANIAPTNLIATPYPGRYAFEVYLAVVSPATSGGPTVNVIFTDDSGISRTVAVATQSVAGGIGGIAIIETNGAAIQYSVTGIVTPGPLNYGVKMGCVRAQP
jgi:hypothetical protein